MSDRLEEILETFKDEIEQGWGMHEKGSPYLNPEGITSEQHAKQAIESYIDTKIIEARIDELNSHVERDTGLAGTIHMESHEVDARIATLSKKKEGGQS